MQLLDYKGGKQLKTYLYNQCKTFPILNGFLIIFLLAGCSTTEEINYRGEGEHWEAFLTLRFEDDSFNGTEKFQLSYKGELEDISEISTLEYSFETIDGTTRSGVTETYSEDTYPQTVIFTYTGLASGDMRGEESVIVIIKWDEFKESFELK